jgi:hypothetical protein
MKRNLAWPLVLVTSTALVGILNGIGVESNLRFVITAAYLLICPGMAYIRLLNLSSRSTVWILAIAASISIDLLVSEIMVLIKLWSANAAYFTIGTFCIAGALVQIIFPERVLAERK